MDRCNTIEELKKVYKKLILKHHPDKGGDAETFNKIQQEYEERLASFEKVSEPVNFEVSLEEAYTGFSKKIRLKTERRCKGCSQECQMCKGLGQINFHLGPFSMSQQCPMCEGRGGSIPNGCGACNKTGITTSTEYHVITAPPGVDSGFQSGKFIIQVKEHPIFERHGMDLLTRIKIPFAHTITGTKFTFNHIRGPIEIDTREWAPIDPRIPHIVKGEGMPPHGDLHIIFDIQYK